MKLSMKLFEPKDFHDVYLKTAKRLGWPVRPECDVPYDELSDDGKALDIALAEFCSAKFNEWLEKQPVVYGCGPEMGFLGYTKNFPTAKRESPHKARLVAIEELKSG